MQLKEGEMTISPKIGLKVEGLCAGYGAGEVFRDLSFELAEGSSLAIVGESGCGKSTLLSALAGFSESLSINGSIRWTRSGRTVDVKSLKTSFVWQQLGLFPWKKVWENLELPLLMSGASSADRRGRTRAMLRELELEGLEGRYPGELSGGQRQRLAIGRALIDKPDVLFMDEPFSALDAMLREHLQDFLAGLRKIHPVSIVLVTHDMSEAVFLGENVLVLGGRPAQGLELIDNAACEASRESDEHFNVVKRIHGLLRASRCSREDRK